MNKKAIRVNMLNKRDLLEQNEIENRSASILEKFLATEHYRNSSLIMVYISIGSEVQTIDLIKAAIKDNKTLAIPLCVTSTKDLRPCKITGLNDLAEGTFGIPEPKGRCEEVDLNQLDIIIVPGIAFDARLNRLGHGAGYYDRFIAKLCMKTIKIGFAFDFQVIDSLPVESHDMPLDILITDKDVIFRK